MWKVVLAAAVAGVAANLCNTCNGNGVCNTATRRCSCFAGFTGPRCEYVACPTGNAWWDFASAVDTAHAPATCSNMGLCSSTTGVCDCSAGFTGAACEFMACPACQSGHCISMRDAAAANDGINFFTSTSYSLWDADKIFGCQCSYGYTGYDCSQRTCPVGDDPLTTGQSPEVQLLNCLCNGCTGYFALYYEGFLTANIAPSATATQLTNALLALTSIHGIAVTLSSGTTVCSTTGTTASITFTNNGGDLPLIQIRSVLSGTNTITLSSKGAVGTYGGTSAAGTTEGLPCSGRGDCNPSTGICTCVPGLRAAFITGAGNPGILGDCGAGTTTACPTVLGKVCNNQGSCDGTTQYRCECNPPYTGAYCTNLLCPTGAAWFDGASATNTAHAVAPCSNRGICNPSTGTCTCQAGFTGAACDLLACPGSPACSGQGSCKTMQQLAALSSSNGVLIGATYGNTPTTPRRGTTTKSEVATAKRYSLESCILRSCAYGDDPYISGTVDEQQQILCTADGGFFTLSFRQHTTSAISASATAATVQTALQALASIVSATVTFGGGATTVCSATGVVTTVRFTYAQGNLPLLIAPVTDLTLSTGTPAITVTETVAGTKANLECSGRGTCDRTLGRCNCYDYFLSSDGYGNVGTRGDCGYLTPYSTLSTTITTITTTTTTTSTV
ncbi:hypothetical protein SPRG_11986 [Saprolegnia parasitica CBS 223.65]|uniref:EGF-like domain-containing protein n=1 Tax=Saprolegnia parasitica (strain CBS 223.65) TaxID=695850 RepID=A0A067BWE9_SAPPC|nr:hypothetical protein SPRG_11986 [Saprolegnia parasitica CBS 223.65]KDO22849.1 hypothetical protein SPRG_11986 [Saprolegnia parasitica CBS 223.65]|eukprot:XP_012206406.1 hypothetical protein SPRG_11986 [Saprolegnia parasitica CBS 223.65]